MSQAWKTTTRCRRRSRSVQKLDVLRANGAKACRKIRCTRSTKAVLMGMPYWVRRSAPSTLRGLSVSSVPCVFWVTHCP